MYRALVCAEHLLKKTPLKSRAMLLLKSQRVKKEVVAHRGVGLAGADLAVMGYSNGTSLKAYVNAITDTLLGVVERWLEQF